MSFSLMMSTWKGSSSGSRPSVKRVWSVCNVGIC